jgi:Bacterial dnaA protein helix-turn-helix
MIAPNPLLQTFSRVPLAVIDRIVSARLGPTRVKGNAQPAAFNRQVAMYLAKHVGGWSTPRIGKFYNGRHHTTVLWAVQRIEAMRTSDPEVDGLISALTEEIRHQAEKDLQCGSSRWADRAARLRGISTLGTIEIDPSAMKHRSTIELASALPATAAIDTATLELLASWKAEDVTTDPEKLREADEEIAQFKKDMNANRAASGARLLFP